MSILKRLFSSEKPRSPSSPTSDMDKRLNSTMICCKLFHFPIRHNGECIRYLFAYANVPYEDVRITFDQWNQSDMSSETPFGELPVLELDGQKISHTIPIARYLASEYNMLPSSKIEQAKADMIVEVVRELSDKLRPVTQAAFFLNDNERKKFEWSKYKKEELLPVLKSFEIILGDKKWLCGSKMCWADLVLGEFFDRLETCFDATVLEQCPTLADHCRRVHSLTPIRIHVEYRPKMEY